ncbi:MAG: PorT family protein [Ignavibacteria bacterium]|nr:PorT family protein [Ignavibacteria bacterium]
MKKVKSKSEYFLFAFLVCIFMFPQISFSQWKLGLTTGVNMTSLSGDSPEDAGYSKGAGLIFGLSGEYNITKDLIINIQPRYVQKKGKIYYEIRKEDPIDSFETELDYFSLPLILKIPALTSITFVNGGIDVSYLSKANIRRITGVEDEKDITEYLNKFDLSFLFGLGLSFNVFKNVSLDAEARYVQSVSNLGKNSELLYNGALPERFRSSGFQLLTNIYYTF